jgi:hypothetical protein
MAIPNQGSQARAASSRKTSVAPNVKLLTMCIRASPIFSLPDQYDPARYAGLARLLKSLHDDGLDVQALHSYAKGAAGVYNMAEAVKAIASADVKGPGLVEYSGTGYEVWPGGFKKIEPIQASGSFTLGSALPECTFVPTNVATEVKPVVEVDRQLAMLVAMGISALMGLALIRK